VVRVVLTAGVAGPLARAVVSGSREDRTHGFKSGHFCKFELKTAVYHTENSSCYGEEAKIGSERIHRHSVNHEFRLSYMPIAGEIKVDTYSVLQCSVLTMPKLSRLFHASLTIQPPTPALAPYLSHRRRNHSASRGTLVPMYSQAAFRDHFATSARDGGEDGIEPAHHACAQLTAVWHCGQRLPGMTHTVWPLDKQFGHRRPGT